MIWNKITKKSPCVLLRFEIWAPRETGKRYTIFLQQIWMTHFRASWQHIFPTIFSFTCSYIQSYRSDVGVEKLSIFFNKFWIFISYKIVFSSTDFDIMHLLYTCISWYYHRRIFSPFFKEKTNLTVQPNKNLMLNQ